MPGDGIFQHLVDFFSIKNFLKGNRLLEKFKLVTFSAFLISCKGCYFLPTYDIVSLTQHDQANGTKISS